ncbi:uncharacterized protein LOC127241059 [Andrographis paniculata]|uniref:uncharacterized protein LOC127241059 n=1 Tax=Andrographis paniculata TaxID=175694 RepID=UPI0021E968A1|nr:uncharacterized protein LOC127241059 [Andrographis paniculata]
MLGKVRASSMSSLEQLEMERPPSKVVKHDSLSIYESTLLKLKQGSRCNPSCNQEDPAAMDTCSITGSPETVKLSNASCSSAESCTTPSPSFQSTESSEESHSQNKSILYFFSKYKNSKEAPKISSGSEAMAVEVLDYYPSSCSISTASRG